MIFMVVFIDFFSLWVHRMNISGQITFSTLLPWRCCPQRATRLPHICSFFLLCSFLHPSLSFAAAFIPSRVLKVTSDVSEPCLCSDEILTINLCKRRLGSKRSMCPRYSCLLLLMMHLLLDTLLIGVLCVSWWLRVTLNRYCLPLGGSSSTPHTHKPM